MYRFLLYLYLLVSLIACSSTVTRLPSSEKENQSCQLKIIDHLKNYIAVESELGSLTDGEILKAATVLISVQDTAFIPPHHLKVLTLLSGKKSEELVNEKVQLQILQKVKEIIGESEFEHAIGQQGVTLKKVAKLLNDHEPLTKNAKPDKRDFVRSFGTRLLRDDDKAFNNPEYMAKKLRQSEYAGTGKYQKWDPIGAISLFKKAWKRLAPKNVTVEAFTLTGTDANNLLYDVALQAVRKKFNDPSINEAELLSFDGIYAGGRGKIAGHSFHAEKRSKMVFDSSEYKIPSPHTTIKDTDIVSEQFRLHTIEQNALRMIREKVENSEKPIGGILLESILGGRGVFFYRTEFLMQLRQLCDELKIPIVADEILTGGGRTGKFFAYSHYQGFEPDFITFGKGLQISGIASVKRDISHQFVDDDYFEDLTTLYNYSDALLRGAAIMNRIADDDLIENAVKMGEYLLKKIKEKEKSMRWYYYPKDETPSRGLGLLIYTKSRILHRVSSGDYRLMPFLDITEEEIDEILK